jgi:hypothetical protein
MEGRGVMAGSELLCGVKRRDCQRRKHSYIKVLLQLPAVVREMEGEKRKKAKEKESGQYKRGGRRRMDKEEYS